MASTDDPVLSRPRHTAPITRLPMEILQHIFVHSMPVARNSMAIPFAELDPARSPLLLTQVCTLWRAISTSTPDLWCSVRVASIPDPSYRNKGLGELLQPMLERWLRNAQTQPLNIVLDNSPSTMPLSRSLWAYILPVFASHVNHWFTLTTSPSIAEYLVMRKVHMPMLKTFSCQHLFFYRFADLVDLVPNLSSLGENFGLFASDCGYGPGTATPLTFDMHLTQGHVGDLDAFPQTLILAAARSDYEPPLPTGSLYTKHWNSLWYHMG